MNTDCSSSATPRVEMGSLRLYCSAKDLRAAVCKSFLEDGLLIGFKPVNGGKGGSTFAIAHEQLPQLSPIQLLLFCT